MWLFKILLCNQYSSLLTKKIKNELFFFIKYIKYHKKLEFFWNYQEYQ